LRHVKNIFEIFILFSCYPARRCNTAATSALVAPHFGASSLPGLDHTTAIEMFYRQIIAEHRLPFQPTVAPTYGEQMLDIIKRKNIPHKAVDVNAEGHIIVDKDKDPELYDWAVRGQWIHLTFSLPISRGGTAAKRARRLFSNSKKRLYLY
jgi:antitoxin component of RelBE/YafQ-DinJ toxin-antitoxin module